MVYSSRRIFNSLLGVSSGDETLHLNIFQRLGKLLGFGQTRHYLITHTNISIFPYFHISTLPKLAAKTTRFYVCIHLSL